MSKEFKKLARKQLQKRVDKVKAGLGSFAARPARGWVRLWREALGMTTYQLAKRLKVGQSRIIQIEQTEISGGLTLKSLQSTADALECDLVYLLVPRKPLEAILEEKADQVAKSKVNYI